MDYETQNSVRNNHDRDHWANGANGGPIVKRDMSVDKGKGVFSDMTQDSMMAVDSEPQGGGLPGVNYQATDDLPEEIPHITADILPLNLILARLAQASHAKLQDAIMALAAKPLPQSAANGNGQYHLTGVEDTSQESLDKKALLLTTLQELHTKWVKALVIANWSKKAEGVSRLIDIRAHLASKLEEFARLFFIMVHNKQELHWAKVPGPDLKTALQVLSTGEVSFMPELGYLEPPPVSLEEKAHWIDNVNTTLSVRLSYHDYQKIPRPFRDYTIDSGRVTFRSKGEFELELTIGDDDFETQYWFMDFRLQYRPAPAQFAAPLRAALEHKVNEILAVDGLAGCYNYLHEFALTQKISEFCRQAVELSRGTWIHSLKVERLNRGMAIQYWVNRPHAQGTQSWIILGIGSGNGPDGAPDPTAPSALSLRWFRDGKEVKDFDIPFDVDTISTEALLTTVVARHVEYVLESIFDKLGSKPRFDKGRTRLELEIYDDPSYSFLRVQLFGRKSTTLRMDSSTGAFILLPPSPPILESQQKLNASPNPVEDAPAILERFRWYYTHRDLSSRAKSIDWTMTGRSPVNHDELKTMIQAATESREAFHAIWLRRSGFNPNWFVMMTMSLGGDRWWLVELYGPRPGSQTPRIRTLTQLPAPGQASFSDEFFRTLTLYVSGIMAQFTDQRELHHHKMSYATQLYEGSGISRKIKLPTHFVRLSDMVRDTRTGSTARPWAKEFIPIVFKGIQPPTDESGAQAEGQVSQARRDSRLKVLAEARVTVITLANFQLLQREIDDDISYDDKTGQFKVQLRAEMGTPTVTLLAKRLRALARLVDFVEAVRRAGKGVVAHRITLREVVFTYSSNSPNASSQPPRAWKVWLELTQDDGVHVKLEPGNPHLPIVDMLRAMGSVNFRTIPTYLQSTLPVFVGVQKMQANWNVIATKNQGCFVSFTRGLHWLTLHFELGGPGRSVELDFRFSPQNNVPAWLLRRAGAGEDGGQPVQRHGDEFDKVLDDKVWSAHGEGIKGLAFCAVAETDQGIDRLLAIVDEAMQSLVGTPAPAPMPAPAPVKVEAAKGTPAQQQQQQQQQQQPLQQPRAAQTSQQRPPTQQQQQVQQTPPQPQLQQQRPQQQQAPQRTPPQPSQKPQQQQAQKPQQRPQQQQLTRPQQPQRPPQQQQQGQQAQQRQQVPNAAAMQQYRQQAMQQLQLQQRLQQQMQQNPQQMQQQAQHFQQQAQQFQQQQHHPLHQQQQQFLQQQQQQALHIQQQHNLLQQQQQQQHAQQQQQHPNGPGQGQMRGGGGGNGGGGPIGSNANAPVVVLD